MNVRRIPRAAPKRPASKTTLSRGEAWPDSEGSDAGWSLVVQSSRANTNAAKSTSPASSRSRSSVVVPGLNDVVQGSTWATSSRPRVSACSSFCCFPEEPRKIRVLPIHVSQEDAEGACGGDGLGNSPTGTVLPGSGTSQAENRCRGSVGNGPGQVVEFGGNGRGGKHSRCTGP